jgi:hypothetical protein
MKISFVVVMSKPKVLKNQICHNPDHNILLSDSGEDVVIHKKSMK